MVVEGSVTVASAPGKVMVAGGYVVLERPNAALVAAVSARVYTVVSDAKGREGSARPELEIVSPQMNETRTYRFEMIEGKNVPKLEKLDDMSSNPYVEACVLYSLAVISARGGKLRALRVSIHGDNSFYSAQDAYQKRFAPISKGDDDGDKAHSAAVKKTGLGSSAALTTSLVASLLAHHGVVKLPFAGGSLASTAAPLPSCVDGEEALDLVHNLAQYCHCMAQGKIGSGFDIGSASFGCCRYVRFSPQLLDASAVLSCQEIDKKVGKDGEFDHVIERWRLPAGVTLMVGDVQGGGSSTPSMVSAIQKWKKENGDSAAELWKRVIQNNVNVAACFFELAELAVADPHAHDKALAQCASSPALDLAGKGKVQDLIARASRCFHELRASMREMGERAGVPLEPPPQTRLLDFTASLPGVCGCGVPGAGGYDAVFAIVIGSQAAEGVRKAWASWQDAEGGSVGLLPIEPEAIGVQVHEHLPTE